MRFLRPNTLLSMAILLAASLTTACVDESEDEWTVALNEESVAFGDLSPGRTFEEELLAEDLEALLPGSWVLESQSAQPDTRPLFDITFLGHDAVSGDLALLLEDPADPNSIEPVRVTLSESEATLRLAQNGRSFRVEQIEDELLVLHQDETNVRLVYTRRR